MRAHDTRSVREIQNLIIRTTSAAPSGVLPVPGPDSAFGSGGRTRVRTDNDVTAADVAFAVVRRVSKPPVCQNPAYEPGWLLYARRSRPADRGPSYLDDLAPDSVRAASGSA